MTPEAAFLLALARGRSEPRPPADPLTSRRILALSESHQVAPLCGWNLEHQIAVQEREAIAREWPALVQGLRLAFRHHLVRNEAIQEELQDLGDRFGSAGVRPLVLKGPWLAFAAYPNPGTRPMGDLDLCVQPEDFSRALAVLNGLGYEPCSPLPSNPEQALRRSHFASQIRLVAPQRTMVELHLRLVNIGRPSREEDWVWNSARSLGDSGMRVPGPEAMLLHLLLHANQHAYAVLRLLEDIRWALHRDAPTIDWDLLIERIGAANVRRSCFHSLTLAREMAGADVPEAVLLRLRPSRIGRHVFAFAWNLRAVRLLEASRPAQALEAPRLALFEVGGLRDKVSFLLEVIAEAGGWAEAFRRLILLLRRPRADAATPTGRN